MLNSDTKAKLRSEIVSLQAEISIVATNNIERIAAARNAGKPLTVDEILEPLNPLTGRVIEIENRIFALSSKRELVAERKGLQSRLDSLLQGSNSLFHLSQEKRLSVSEMNNKISKLDRAIKSKGIFDISIDGSYENIRIFFYLAACAVAIGGIVFMLFN